MQHNNILSTVSTYMDKTNHGSITIHTQNKEGNMTVIKRQRFTPGTKKEEILKHVERDMQDNDTVGITIELRGNKRAMDVCTEKKIAVSREG